jgi:hypothetical protein
MRQGIRSLTARPEPDPLRDLEPEFLALYEECKPFTMISAERMYAVYSAVRHIISNDVSGAIVECGVWRGGCMMLAALTLQANNSTRPLFLFDTFTGMTQPTDKDVRTDGSKAIDIWLESRSGEGRNWAFASLEEVETNLARTGLPQELLTFVQGDVLYTVPEQAPKQIALLRLDTDWYESTKHELEQLYPRLTPGGVLIIDDYGHWKGSKDAVDEYLASLDNSPFLMRVDYTGRLAIKPR